MSITLNNCNSGPGSFRSYPCYRISPGLHRTCCFHSIRRSIDYKCG